MIGYSRTCVEWAMSGLVRGALASPTRRLHGDVVDEQSPRTTAALHSPSGFSPALRQSCEMSCAQTAIIPTNSVIDASAAASSTKILNIALSLRQQEHRENIVPFLFYRQGKLSALSFETDRFG
jgi:hypothetical protein